MAAADVACHYDVHYTLNLLMHSDTLNQIIKLELVVDLPVTS